MNRNVLRQSVNVLAVIATIVINGLANALPLNGLTTGEISDRFEVYFVPAGYVFSIWGLIYLLLILFAVFQALPGQGDNRRLKEVGYLFALSCLANAAWLFLWHYEQFPLTLLAMLSLLVLLILVYLRLGIGQVAVAPVEKWLVQIPFSIYLGWITVATIANATSLLAYWNWSGWGLGDETWTIIMLLAGAGIASAVSLTRGDIAYVLVIVWAFVGIAARHGETPVVAIAAWVAAVLAVLMLIVGALSSRRRRRLSVSAG